MSNQNDFSYEDLDVPYNSLLERSEGSLDVGSMESQTEGQPETPSDSSSNIIEGSSFNNLWINSWIKSRSYKPKSQGFLIDGMLGYIECMKLYVGAGGIVGGSLNVPNETDDDSFHVNSSGDSWWGCNVADFVADNDNADAYILKTGVAKFQSIEVVGGVIDGTSTIGGRTASTLASAINATGNFVDSQFNTLTKEILGDFTFGVSGAIKMITDVNNGLWISPTGILGKKAGVTTLAVDTSGNASFRGDVVITGGSGIASLTDAGSLATLDDVGASNCNSTIISGGKIITGLLTASNIQTGSLTSIVIQTSASANTGVKMSSALGGVRIYGETLQIYSGSTSYGTIGGDGAYFNFHSISNRNVRFEMGSGSMFISGASIAPLTSGSASSGLSSQFWSNVFTNNVTLSSGKYFNYTGGYIQSNSQFRVVGSITLTGNLTFENSASITINGRAYYETTGAYDAAKYYLRSA